MRRRWERDGDEKDDDDDDDDKDEHLRFQPSVLKKESTTAANFSPVIG